MEGSIVIEKPTQEVVDEGEEMVVICRVLAAHSRRLEE